MEDNFYLSQILVEKMGGSILKGKTDDSNYNELSFPLHQCDVSFADLKQTIAL